MFKLTAREQKIVAFLVAAIVLGTVVKEWRARHPKPSNGSKSETRAN